MNTLRIKDRLQILEENETRIMLEQREQDIRLTKIEKDNNNAIQK